MRTAYSFPEERRKCGQKDSFRPLTLEYERYKEYKENIFCARVASHPWWVILWEPLTTKVPSPALVQPYCCYIRTVIFYVRGYIVRPFSYYYTIRGYQKAGERFSTLEQYETVEHLFRHDDKIEFENEVFEIQGASVVWHNKMYWMRYRARRQHKPVTDFSIKHIS